jgi:FtsP/CotA-like multicopper oxidase with cupredoxin domain
MRGCTWLLLLLLPLASWAQEGEHDHHNMQIASTGVVMNENRDTLPEGCEEISREHEFTIHAGRQYADDQHGMIYGLSEVDVHVAPCSRVAINFVNDDKVRHQWMVHGLPRYLYPAGMFHIEAMGGQSQKGVFIVPPEDRDYLIHCDMSQHMEKGMRGQLVVGKGSGDLWAVAGVSDAFYRSSYQRPASWLLVWVLAVVAFVATLTMLGYRKY